MGAGFAGLSAAWHARQRGVDPLVLDAAAEPGGAWTRMDPTMRCLSPRSLDRLPDGMIPQGEGSVASAAEVLDAIRLFAARLGPRARYGARVQTVDRRGEVLALRLGQEVLETRALVAATGIAGAPRGLALPDIEDFNGTLLPALGLHHRLDEVGPRVLVVGAGNSGHDAVRLLVETGRQVTLASATPLRSQGAYPGGLEGHVRWALSALPVRLLPHFLRCGAVLPVDDLLEEATRDGRVRLVGEVRSVWDAGAHCAPAPGDEGPDVSVHADTLVVATGYQRDLGWLGDLVQRDEQGTPLHEGGLVSRTPGVGLLGLDCMRTRRSGFLRGMSDDARAVVDALL